MLDYKAHLAATLLGPVRYSEIVGRFGDPSGFQPVAMGTTLQSLVPSGAKLAWTQLALPPTAWRTFCPFAALRPERPERALTCPLVGAAVAALCRPFIVWAK